MIVRSTLRMAVGAMLCAAILAAGCETQPTPSGTPSPKKPSIKFDNATFYDADGAFLVDKAKDAYITLMKYHGYPVFPDMKENLWASDYGTGKFTELGLCARMFDNNTEDKYMVMDLFLLPNQMLPEHWHLEQDGLPAKREGWLIRHGQSHVVGIGEPNLSPDVKIPQCHMGGKAETMHETLANPGDFVRLAKVETKHWQFAGPEGVILTEVANCHNDKAVRHSDEKINDHFLNPPK